MKTPTRIIVAEDEALSRDMLVRRLEERGFDVHGCASADEAMLYLESNIADLLLMDNDLPGTSGIQAVRLLRKHWSHDSLPIIMVSALVDSEDIIAGLEAGANDYVVKPVNFQVLMARIRTALTLRANITALVEAERQRVVMRSLASAAGSVAAPIAKMIDELEGAINSTDKDPAIVTSRLHMLLELTDRAVGVIDELRRIAVMRDIPFTDRMDFLQELSRREKPAD
ncbi:MAG: response regulator transcription factor [Burkholderiales bacterium]|nr:response regulator transcription factor [Phycisphaerae bacterium]